MQEDVENGTADLLKPIKLRDTRSEYQDFDTGVFVDMSSKRKELSVKIRIGFQKGIEML